MSRGWLSWKSLVIAVCLVALAVVLVVGSRWFDSRADRRRPMYYSVIRLEDLEWPLLKANRPPVLKRFHHNLLAGTPPVLVKITPKSHAVNIGGVAYRPKPNVLVLVRKSTDGVCVRGKNQYGDHTKWICIDTALPAPKLGGLQ